MKSGTFLKFNAPRFKDYDIYNPTAPFDYDGTRLIAARLESRSIETDSRIVFFHQNKQEWVLDQRFPILQLQDPFVARIQSQWLVGGVKFPIENSWKTILYRGSTLETLDEFAEGPLTMKDIRIVELHDGRIGVFTRLMGSIGGRGTVGFKIVDTLSELRGCNFLDANLIEHQFGEGKWGGVNQVTLLQPGLLGVIGHVAEFGCDSIGTTTKHYRAISFVYNYLRLEASPFKVIAERSQWPAGESKRSPELDDVCVPGGIYLTGDGEAELFAGLSDVASGVIRIQDPFAEFR